MHAHTLSVSPGSLELPPGLRPRASPRIPLPPDRLRVNALLLVHVLHACPATDPPQKGKRRRDPIFVRSMRTTLSRGMRRVFFFFFCRQHILKVQRRPQSGLRVADAMAKPLSRYRPPQLSLFFCVLSVDVSSADARTRCIYRYDHHVRHHALCYLFTKAYDAEGVPLSPDRPLHVRPTAAVKTDPHCTVETGIPLWKGYEHAFLSWGCWTIKSAGCLILTQSLRPDRVLSFYRLMRVGWGSNCAGHMHTRVRVWARAGGQREEGSKRGGSLRSAKARLHFCVHGPQQCRMPIISPGSARSVD